MPLERRVSNRSWNEIVSFLVTHKHFVNGNTSKGNYVIDAIKKTLKCFFFRYGFVGSFRGFSSESLINNSDEFELEFELFLCGPFRGAQKQIFRFC